MILKSSYYEGHTLDLIERQSGPLWTIVNDWFLPILASVGLTILLIFGVYLLVAFGKIIASVIFGREEKDNER